MNKHKSSFFLTKWYLDCVTENGDVWIGYATELNWKKLRLHHVATLQCIDSHISQHNQANFKKALPHENGHSVLWNSPELDISGNWLQRGIPIKKRLFESDAGNIDWCCDYPSADVTIRTGSGENVSGLGYVERLEMSLKPWDTPIDSLRWGRFISETDYIVWISWEGSFPLQLVYRNGKLDERGRVSDGFIEFGEQSRLEFDNSLVLREGQIGNTALSALSFLTSITPLKLLNANECKWRSWGTLKQRDQTVSQGWTIHELVTFT